MSELEAYHLEEEPQLPHPPQLLAQPPHDEPHPPPHDEPQELPQDEDPHELPQPVLQPLQVSSQ